MTDFATRCEEAAREQEAEAARCQKGYLHASQGEGVGWYEAMLTARRAASLLTEAAAMARERERELKAWEDSMRSIDAAIDSSTREKS